MGQRYQQRPQERRYTDNKCMKWFSTSFVFREMKIKTTKRYHYTSFRMAKIQNTDNTKMLIRMWSILLHCWCKIKTIQPLWKTVWCMHAKLLIMSNSLWMNYSPPGSSVHGTLQARILQWVAMPSSRGLPDPGIKLTSLMPPALAGRFFIIVPPGKP